MKCPVCRYEYIQAISECPQCGFPELGRTFISTEDANEWIQTSVESCRRIWNKVQENVGGQELTLANELNKYFPYSMYCNRLKENRYDNIARSWLVDYLSQIIVYKNNYPIENRNELINETIKHITYFISNEHFGNELRMQYCATAYLTVLAEIYLVEWDLVSALGCYMKYLESSVFFDTINGIKNGNEILVYDEAIYFVIHNCAVISKMAGDNTLFLRFADLCKRVSEISYKFEKDKEYNVIYFRGIKRCIISKENGEELNCYLRTQGNTFAECTYQTCNHESNIFSPELDMNLWVGCDIEVKSTEYTYELDTVTLPKDKLVIEKQRSHMQACAKRILAMFIE